MMFARLRSLLPPHPIQQNNQSTSAPQASQTSQTPLNIDALKASLDDSSDKNRNFLIAFLLLEFYLLFAALGTTDIDLLLSNSIFKFPFIDLEISINVFYIIAPIILCAFHFNLLFNLLEHNKKLHQWLDATKSNRATSINQLHAFIFNTKAKYEEIAPPNFNYRLLNMATVAFVSIFPLFLLVLYFWRYAAYQNLVVTFFHLFLIWFNLKLHKTYWLRIRHHQLLAPQYDNHQASYPPHYHRSWGNQIMNLLKATTLLICLLVFSGYWIPVNISNWMQLNWFATIMPHINVSNTTITSLSAKGKANLDKDFEQIQITQDPRLTMIARVVKTDKTNNPIKITDITECQLQQHYQKLDLSKRNLKYANLSGLTHCHIDFSQADLRGAQITNSTFSGNFDGADLTAARLSHSKFQQGSSFISTNLSYSDLSYVVANAVDFTLADLSQAKLLATELNLANLLQSNLQQSEITSAQLNGANLRTLDTTNTTFSHTDLNGIDLRFALSLPDSNFFESKINSCLVDSMTLDNGKISHLFDQAHCRVQVLEPVPSKLNSYLDKLYEESKENDITIRYQPNKDQSSLVNNLLKGVILGEHPSINLANFDLHHIPNQLDLVQSLQNIDLSRNQLNWSQFKILIQMQSELERLTLAHNLINQIPTNFEDLTELVDLDLSFNQLSVIPSMVMNHQQLSSLKLSNNNIVVLQLQDFGPHKLSYLDLTTNRLTALPEQITEFSKLVELRLADNYLGALPNNIGSLSNLERITLQSNNLTALPASFAQLNKIDEIDLSRNFLTDESLSIHLPPQLSALDLSRNLFSSTPKPVFELSSLKRLSLSYNDIPVIDEDIKRLTSLQSLDMSGNKLTRLVKELAQLPLLTTLVLETNQLDDLSLLATMTQLKTLRLDSNNIGALPEDLSQLTKLSKLDLSFNPLEHFPKGLLTLKNLTSLKLQNTAISSIPDTINQLTSLSELNLADNQLKTLPRSLLALPSLLRINVKNNQLLCPPQQVADQGLKEIKGWFRLNQCDIDTAADGPKID